jgi:hypothetical protein
MPITIPITKRNCHENGSKYQWRSSCAQFGQNRYFLMGANRFIFNEIAARSAAPSQS